MKQFIRTTKRIIGGKRAAALWELFIALLILFSVLYCSMSFIGVFIQFESLSYATKSVARQIEVTGSYDEATVLANIEQLLQNANLTKGTENNGEWFTIEVGELTDTSTSSELAASLTAQSKLQLRQPFSITLHATYHMHMIGAKDDSLLGSWSIAVPLSYTVRGMSEVYWRS